MGIKEMLIAFRSPWQSPYVERLIGSIGRECPDHMIVFGQEHPRRMQGHPVRTVFSGRAGSFGRVGGAKFSAWLKAVVAKLPKPNPVYKPR